MSTLLVIGGTGFFGKSILDAYGRGLLAQWGIDSVKILSRNASHFKNTYPKLVSKTVELINGDIASCKTMPDADIVIHAAASTDATRYIDHPDQERRNIELGVLNYCQLSKNYHKNSKILYISSGAVYGTQKHLGSGFVELDSRAPISDIEDSKRHYAEAKRAAEGEIIKLGLQSDISVSIARCFAFVGQYLPRNQHFAIGNFLEDGLQGRKISVKANRKVFRSYMYADDLVKWLMTIASSSSPACPIYNVGSDQAIEIHELARQIAIRFGVNLDIVKITEEVSDIYVPSTQKALLELGLRCKFNLEEALNQTILDILGA